MPAANGFEKAGLGSIGPVRTDLSLPVVCQVSLAGIGRYHPDRRTQALEGSPYGLRHGAARTGSTRRLVLEESIKRTNLQLLQAIGYPRL